MLQHIVGGEKEEKLKERRGRAGRGYEHVNGRRRNLLPLCHVCFCMFFRRSSAITPGKLNLFSMISV
jgi:hypothetical protein